MRTRAMPLTLECVQAMAIVAHIRKRPEMAQALLLGFVGLLRVGEFLNTKLSNFNFLEQDYMILALLESKGSARSAQVESVVFRDKVLIAQIKGRFLVEGSDAS